MLNHIDKEILIIAEDVAIFHLGVHESTGNSSSHQSSLCRNLEDFVRKHNWASYVQVVNDRGSIACFSENMASLRLPLDKKALQSAQKGTPYIQTYKGLGPGSIRMITYPVFIGNRLSDMIQIGQPMSAMEEALHHHRLNLLLISPLIFFLLSLTGWLLSGRAIEPMINITDAAQKINAENLSRRLPVGKGGDEIDRLAETINATLDRLANSFDKIKQFTGDASHEMRTPLAILKGETEVALRWAKDPEELRTTLESNLEEINRMDRILEDLLSLAKSEAGEINLKVRPFSLSDLLQDLYLQGNALAEQKGMDVSLKLDVDREITIEGDALQLRRVFLNLLTNSIKYTPEGGKIELRLSLSDDDVVVDVRDDGIGIDEKHLPHLFDRFYRVDDARNRSAGGTGLGLAISKALVDAHRGRIAVSSTVGKGSCFTVYLPLKGPFSRDEKNTNI